MHTKKYVQVLKAHADERKKITEKPVTFLSVNPINQR